MNFLLFNRASKPEYDAWNEFGNQGWGWGGLLDGFKASSTTPGTGLVSLVQSAPPRRWHATAVQQDAFIAPTPTARTTLVRKYWSKQEIRSVYDTPLLHLVFRAATVHRAHNDPNKIQLCTLMNIKSTRFSTARPFRTNTRIQLVAAQKIV